MPQEIIDSAFLEQELLETGTVGQELQLEQPLLSRRNCRASPTTWGKARWKSGLAQPAVSGAAENRRPRTPCT